MRRRSVSRACAAGSTTGWVALAGATDSAASLRKLCATSSAARRSDSATSAAVVPAEVAMPLAGRPGSGITKMSTMYRSARRPPVRNVARTKNTRTRVGSTARYSASPPHTPAMTRLLWLRSSRREDMETFPSLAEFVGDGHREAGDRGDRHRRLLELTDHAVHRNGDPRREGDGPGEPFGEERRRKHREGDRARRDQDRC